METNDSHLTYLQQISDSLSPYIIANSIFLQSEKNIQEQENLKKDINNDLSVLIDALKKIGDYKIVPLEIVYYLIQIKKYNIENVNLILEKSDIENYLNSTYSAELFKRIDDNKPIDKEFINYFTYALSNQKIDPKKAIPYINRILYEHINNKTKSLDNNVSEELLANCFIYLTKHYMKKYVDKPIVEIKEFESHNNHSTSSKQDYIQTGGTIYKKGKIEFNKILIKDFYLLGNIDIFYTMFHELIHIKQGYNTYKKASTDSYENYTNLKDHIIQGYIDEYYNENYFNISFERDAVIKSSILAEAYFNSIGIVSENMDEIKIRIHQALSKYSNPLRKINGKDEDIDTIFNEIIKKNPDLIKQYPQLEIEWVLDKNNNARKKTYTELDDEINNIDQDIKTLNKEKNKKTILELHKRLKLLIILRDQHPENSKGRKR